MTEGRAGEHSDQVPPIADEVGGAAPSAPVVELAQAKSDTPSGMRRRIAVVIALLVAVLLLFLLLELLFMGTYLVINSIGGNLESSDFQAGRGVFAMLRGVLLATCMLFLPAYSGFRLAVREEPGSQKIKRHQSHNDSQADQDRSRFIL